MEDPSQPILLMGYHRGDVNHPDNAVFEAISEVLAGGRSSRLYTALVKEKKVALAAGAIPGLGQDKYPGLFLFYAVPNKGNSNAECEAAIEEEIARLQREPVSEAELAGVKTRSKAALLASLDSNMGLAMQLVSAENLEGDWREAFRSLDEVDRVTAEDIMRVASATFTRSNRTVGMIETASEPADEPASP
jgi:predicted Zn-dependent peptidase